MFCVPVGIGTSVASFLVVYSELACCGCNKARNLQAITADMLLGKVAVRIQVLANCQAGAETSAAASAASNIRWYGNLTLPAARIDTQLLYIQTMPGQLH
jgi:hypothetical protein